MRVIINPTGGIIASDWEIGVVEYFKVEVLTTCFLSITRSLTSKYGLK